MSQFFISSDDKHDVRHFSHEVNNSLSVIYCQLQYIESQFPILKNRYEWLHVKEDILKLSSMLQNHTQEDQTENASVFAVNPLLHDLYVSWKCAFEQKNILLQYYGNQDPVLYLYGNSSEFTQIVNNLLKNSLEAIEEKFKSHSSSEFHGKCSMVLAHYKDQILFTVSDNGTGIPNSVIDQIYNEGFSTKGENHGNGLYIVKKLVKQFHGSIHVRSSQKTGTIFHLNFLRSMY